MTLLLLWKLLPEHLLKSLSIQCVMAAAGLSYMTGYMMKQSISYKAVLDHQEYHMLQL